MPARPSRLQSLPPSGQLIVALLAGIFCGLLFGERVAFLYSGGEAFILLLKMTALPYVMLSLISTIGRLSYAQARLFASRVGLFLLLSWLLALGLIMAFPLSFPDWQSASFFSSSLVTPPSEIDFLELYIPANPFHAMANNLVPAVVIFSIALGVALIGVDDKQATLRHIDVFNEALTRVTRWVIRLNPLGVFALSASLAGTMRVDEFDRLQVYLVSHILLTLGLSLVLLPLLVSSLTRLSYRQLLAGARDVLVLALVTDSFLAVLPTLAERCKDLAGKITERDQHSQTAVDVILPALYNVPKAGALTGIGFVLFAAWFNGSPIPALDYPQLAVSGLFSLFSHVTVAVPFLLDLYQIPADMLQLFLSTGVVTGRLSTMTNAMHALCVTLLGAAAINGALRLAGRRMLLHGMLALLALTLLILAARALFGHSVGNQYRKDEVIAGMQLLRRQAPAARVANTPAPTDAATGALGRILQRGVLLACHSDDDLPFSFHNDQGQLVGFDIDMGRELAHDLGVGLQWVPVSLDDMGGALQRGDCDLLISSIAMTPQRAAEVRFAMPHLEETVAFVVADERRWQFRSREQVEAMPQLRLGVPDIAYFADKLQSYLPNAQIHRLDSPKEFFEGRAKELDALAYTAEAGSAWTLLYPRYSVVVPHPLIMNIPVCYALARQDRDLAEYINLWLELKKKDMTLQTFYDYWILGKTVGKRQPRWSILHDVLHWLD